MAEKLLAKNYFVIGLGRHHEKFSPNHPNYVSYFIDFKNINDLEPNLKYIQANHENIDVIISSAGYGEFAELEQFSVKKMQTLLNVNFLSQAVLAKTFLSKLKQKKSGKIIFIGSECALEGQKKATMYCATKFALRGFAQSLRKECATANVTVTLINPGMVDTPFFDSLSFRPAPGEGHAIDAEQIASLILTLIEEKNNCVYEEVNLQPMKKVLEKNPRFES